MLVPTHNSDLPDALQARGHCRLHAARPGPSHPSRWPPHPRPGRAPLVGPTCLQIPAHPQLLTHRLTGLLVVLRPLVPAVLARAASRPGALSPASCCFAEDYQFFCGMSLNWDFFFSSSGSDWGCVFGRKATGFSVCRGFGAHAVHVPYARDVDLAGLDEIGVVRLLRQTVPGFSFNTGVWSAGAF